MAVGAKILKFIVGHLGSGFRKRWERTDAPLNIIIGENRMDANLVLENILKGQVTEEELRRFDRSIGLMEASIDMMEAVQTEQMKAIEPTTG